MVRPLRVILPVFLTVIVFADVSLEYILFPVILGSLLNILISIKAIDFKGKVTEFDRKDIQFFYRGTNLPENIIIFPILSNKGNNLELINLELALFDVYQLISNIKILNNAIDQSMVDTLFKVAVIIKI